MTLDIELKLDKVGRGAFILEKEGDRLAEMAIAIQNKNVIVYHTEVAEKLKGQGVASALLTRMVAYARENTLKVVPLCPYVLAQFKKHPDEYDDVWNRNWHH